jgi:hypothetical protein
MRAVESIVRVTASIFVIPAKAGIRFLPFTAAGAELDPGLRRDDENGAQRARRGGTFA